MPSSSMIVAEKRNAMKKKNIQLAEILDHGNLAIEDPILKLANLLKLFRYEGKASLGRNLKEARGLRNFFQQELTRHVPFEEGVIFSFLRRHIPRVEPMIWLLEEEHEDLNFYLKTFKEEIEELAKAQGEVERIKILDKLEVTGTYLIYLLKHHLRTEKNYLYNVVDRELKANEKKRLLLLSKNRRGGEKNGNGKRNVS